MNDDDQLSDISDGDDVLNDPDFVPEHDDDRDPGEPPAVPAAAEAAPSMVLDVWSSYEDAERVVEVLKELYAPPADDDVDVFAGINRLFPDAVDAKEADVMHSVMSQHMEVLNGLRQFADAGLLPVEWAPAEKKDKRREYHAYVNQWVFALYAAHHSVVHAKLFRASQDDDVRSAITPAAYTMYSVSSKMARGDCPPRIIAMYEMVLNLLYRLGARRFGDEVYIPRYEKTEGGDKYFTYTWTPFNHRKNEGNRDTQVTSTIRDFMFCEVQSKHPAMWAELNDGKAGIVKPVIDMLTSVVDDRFPALRRDWNVIAFTNCLFNTRTLEVFPFDPDHPNSATKLHIDRVPLMFLKHRLSYDLYDATIAAVPPDENGNARWDAAIEIQTPFTDSILTAQGIPKEAIVWIYILLARMFHEVGTDNWQVAPLLKGVPGSGKSTLARILQSMVPPELFGTVPNRGRITFQAEHFANKLMAWGMDMDKKSHVDGASCNSWICGEAYANDQMYKTTTNMPKWTTPVGFICNEFFMLQVGAQRRLPPILFNTPIRNGDPMLFNKCLSETGALMYKMQSLYRAASARYQDVDIWNVFPQYFRDSRKTMIMDTNPIAGFILGSDMVELKTHQADPNVSYVMPFARFKVMCKEFLDANGIRTKLTNDELDNAFNEFNIKRFRAGGHEGEQLGNVRELPRQAPAALQF
jgi:energy-coupling factor transporter ATP-binding protein EcfA2